MSTSQKMTQEKQVAVLCCFMVIFCAIDTHNAQTSQTSTKQQCMTKYNSCLVKKLAPDWVCRDTYILCLMSGKKYLLDASNIQQCWHATVALDGRCANNTKPPKSWTTCVGYWTKCMRKVSKT